MATIACVDETASDRRLLVETINNAYQHCRKHVGHLDIPLARPMSVNEVLINSPQQAVVIGSRFSIEKAFLTAKSIRDQHPNQQIAVILDSNAANIMTINRFARISDAVIISNESAERLVVAIGSLVSSAGDKALGALVTVQGVKGGVGATSILTGLSQAVEAQNNKVVIVDLSRQSVVPFYLKCTRWQSADYRTALLDRYTPDLCITKKCIAQTSNGLDVLLPPAGGIETRELWLRDPDTFEISLGMINQLREIYDYVFVDLEAAEGALPLSLLTQSTSRILVSSNDHSSVHLLTNCLSQVAEIPGGPIHIIINEVKPNGVKRKDILRVLELNDRYSDLMTLSDSICYDTEGADWIGTRNSFYVQASNRTRNILRETIFLLNKNEDDLEQILRDRRHGSGNISKHFQRTSQKTISCGRKALPSRPHLEYPQSAVDNKEHSSTITAPVIRAVAMPALSDTTGDECSNGFDSPLIEPPRKVS